MVIYNRLAGYVKYWLHFFNDKRIKYLYNYHT
jgi:hypothetical protein